ncbi:MAG: hypothetical protein KA714_22980 [Limnoraphis sp. WC205]|nr:hypothetical protein [Limnoraphis sp. WC205]
MTQTFRAGQKSKSPKTSSPVQTSQFASRPFPETVQQKAQQPNLQTILQRAERAGNPISEKPIQKQEKMNFTGFSHDPLGKGQEAPPQAYEMYKNTHDKQKDQITKRVHQKLNDLLEKSKDEEKGTEYREKLRKDVNLKDQRALDRLAWVLAHLKDARECVAVNLTTSQKLYVWANKFDREIVQDVKDLLSAATEMAQQASDQLVTVDKEVQSAKEKVWDKLQKSKLGLRQGSPEARLVAQAERRLSKTLEFLEKLLQNNKQIVPQAIQPKYVEAGKQEKPKSADQKLHAELRGADLYYFLKETETEIGKLQGSFGISKLCCFQCSRALIALAKTEDIEITTTGSHFNTYGNWPPPKFLEKPEVLKNFLEVTDQDQQFTQWIDDESTKSSVLYAIQSFKGGKGHQTTDYPSSGDEKDIECTQDPSVKGKKPNRKRPRLK